MALIKLDLQEYAFLWDQNQSKPKSKGYTQYHTGSTWYRRVTGLSKRSDSFMMEDYKEVNGN